MNILDEDSALIDARCDVKDAMKRYRSLPEYLLDGVWWLLTFSTLPLARRKKLLPTVPPGTKDFGLASYLLSGLTIAVLTLLTGWLVSWMVEKPFTVDDIEVSVWAAFSGALAMMANKFNIRTFLEIFDRFIIDKITRPGDIEDLKKWLDNNFKVFWPFTAGYIGGIALAWIVIANLKGGVPNTGAIVVLVLSCVQSVWTAYYLTPFYVLLPERLSRYQFDLFKNDPSSSEVLRQLSHLITLILYVTTSYIVVLTIGLNLIELLTVNTAVVFSLLVWAPTILLYILGQYYISTVISRAKWDHLNEIQSKIESLSEYVLVCSNAEIKKESLEVIEKMMDTHDRIKNTPNSVLNIRSSLTFLNSLLLPILAFLAANLTTVLNEVQKWLND